MARTDALAVEGWMRRSSVRRPMLKRVPKCCSRRRLPNFAMYRQFADAVQVPILANITEFGATPLFTTDELRSAHVAMALYPLLLSRHEPRR